MITNTEESTMQTSVQCCDHLYIFRRSWTLWR